MIRRAFLALVACLFAIACLRDPVVPVPDGGTGGAAAMGGSQATGGESSLAGSPATGGQSAIAGASSTGGTQATGGSSAAIEWPDCAPATQKVTPKDLERFRRMLQPLHKPGAMHSKPRASYQVLDLPDVAWWPLCPTLDQGSLGSCTGNAAVQCRCSEAFGVPTSWVGRDAIALEAIAVDVYGGATHIDPFDGVYPPDDTGSDGESVLTILKQRGLVNGWTSPITFEGVQRALQTGPGIFGSPWRTSDFTPDRCGQLPALAGIVEGGHEYVVRAIQYSTKRILFQNSWGNDWGAKRKGQGGFFWRTFGAVQQLMNEGADFKFPSVTRTANDNAALPLAG